MCCLCNIKAMFVCIIHLLVAAIGKKIIRIINMKKLSSTGISHTKMDVLILHDQLNKELKKQKAKECGLCLIRESLYSDCFYSLGRSQLVVELFEAFCFTAFLSMNFDILLSSFIVRL